MARHKEQSESLFDTPKTPTSKATKSSGSGSKSGEELKAIHAYYDAKNPAHGDLKGGWTY